MPNLLLCWKRAVPANACSAINLGFCVVHVIFIRIHFEKVKLILKEKKHTDSNSTWIIGTF
jgi:hypothetical protein